MTEMIEPTDSIVSPDSTSQADVAVVAQLLDQILDKAHPLLAEGLYLAAVSHEYNGVLFKALRARDDGRDERLVARLARFSFITPLDDDAETPGYTMLPTEREILSQRWIAADPEAFVAAHRRALAFWEAHPHPDPFAQDQNRLYHLLIADGETGLEQLADTFRACVSEHRLAAADRLLATATQARGYLMALAVPWLADFDDLLTYLTARLAQCREEWQESLPSLEKLRQRTDLSPRLVPHVARAYGHALAEEGQYVEAMEQYQVALKAFGQRPEGRVEQAFTMINLGDAYVDLAVSARGYREIIVPPALSWRYWLQGVLSLRGLLPLIAYLSWHFGLRVWYPRFWPMLQQQDWIIARLFVTGARWYRQAKKLFLDAQVPHADRVQADEKLAHLYLTMGDTALAASSFRSLLEEQDPPLSEYRRASVQAGLGQALLRLRRLEPALEQLQKALPVIQAYDDIDLEAQMRGHLAEVLFECDRSAEALAQFRRALRLYQKSRDTVGATEIAERLQELGQDQRLSDQERKTASTTTQNITRRRYLNRFHHPVLVAFQRASLILLPVLVFIIPLLTIHMTGDAVFTDIHFYPAPLLEPDPDYVPVLDQAMEPIVPSFNAEFVLWPMLVLILLYLLVYTLLGIFVIARTPLSTVQAAQSEAVEWNLHGLSIGRGKTARTVHREEIDRVFTADVELLRDLMLENSTTLVASPRGEITIKGSTAWYTALQDHIRSFLPREARVVNLGYRVLRSWAGGLYVVGLLSFVLFILLREWAPQFLTASLMGTPYSLVDVYAYFYLGVFLPPVWWIVIRPLYIQAHLNPRNTLAWWIGLGGVLLAILRWTTVLEKVLAILGWTTVSNTWLILPDIYFSLAIIILGGSAGVTIWMARLPVTRQTQQEPHVYPFGVRGLVMAATVTILVVTGLGLWREVSAYHYLIVGNSRWDEGIQAQDEDQDAVATWLLERAVVSYDRVLDLSPGNETALNSRAAVQAQLGRYEAAIADYTSALKNTQNVDHILAYRAIAYESWGLDLWDDGQADKAQEKLDVALSDFDQAIHLDPENVDYYMWRGVAYHALGQLDDALANFDHVVDLAPKNVPALIGRGWVYFQKANDPANDWEENEVRENLDHALESFLKATEVDPDSPEAWVAVGYAYFRLEEYKDRDENQYQDTMAAWEKAIELTPDDPLAIISHGMGYWLLAGSCSSRHAPLEEERETITYLNLAIDDLNRALAVWPDDDWTYRTRAQIEYQLAFCPGHDYKKQLETAIASYDQALAYAPDEALYWQFRARLGQALGMGIFLDGPEHETEAWVALTIAMADINRAYSLDGEDEANQAWRDYINEEAWGRYHFVRGWVHYEAGNYSLAEADSEKAALFLPQDTEAAFNAGLMALAQGKNDQATGWYDEGLKRAAIITETRTCLQILQTGTNDLAALLETNPRLRWLGDPILGNLHLHLGEAYHAVGNYAIAGAEFEQAASLRPQDVATAFKAGLFALALGKATTAAEWYDEGLNRALAIEEIESYSQLLQAAIEDLTTLLAANPRLRWLGTPLLERLQAAASE